jgi:hypothetical protein
MAQSVFEQCIVNPNLVKRRRLSAEQAADVWVLVTALFEDIPLRKRGFPFASNITRFQGHIEFRENWILLED